MQLLSISCMMGSSAILLFHFFFTPNQYKFGQPWYLWLIGASTITISKISFVLAFRYAPAAQVDLINYLWPIMVVVFSSFLSRERLSIAHVIASCFGFLSIYVLFSDDHGYIYFQNQHAIGYFLALLAALFWAFYSMFSRHQQNSSPILIGAYTGITALLSLIVHVFYESSVLPTALEWVQLMIFGIGLSGLAYSLWDKGIKSGNFKLLTIFSYFTPLCSIFALILFGYATWSYSLLGSCFLMIIATFICFFSMDRQPKKSPAEAN